MSRWEARVEVVALPMLPTGPILSPIGIKFDSQLRCRDLSPLKDLRVLSEQHNRQVALVDLPGIEEQWCLSSKVIDISRKINDITLRACTDIAAEMSHLQTTIQQLSESIPITRHNLKKGQWACKLP